MVEQRRPPLRAQPHHRVRKGELGEQLEQPRARVEPPRRERPVGGRGGGERLELQQVVVERLIVISLSFARHSLVISL